MVVFGNGALRAQYYILTLQRMFKSTSSGYRVDKLGYVSCIRPLKIFCRSLGHIGPVVLDKTLKYRKIIMQICLPIGKKLPVLTKIYKYPCIVCNTPCKKNVQNCR